MKEKNPPQGRLHQSKKCVPESLDEEQLMAEHELLRSKREK